MQTTPLEFAEVQKFRFDAHIQASDGEAGRLVSVIADAERRALTHAGIRTRTFSRTIYYMPLNLVISGDDDEVTLSLPRDEVEQKYTAVPFGERLTRSGVLWRKIAFGCHSKRGCRFVERILTVVQTLRLQHRPVLEFLYRSLLAYRKGAPPPKLVDRG